MIIQVTMPRKIPVCLSVLALVALVLVDAAGQVSRLPTAPGRALAAEMKRMGKPHLLTIYPYPPFGTDAWTGHNVIFGSVRTWSRRSSRFSTNIFAAEALSWPRPGSR